MIAVVFNYATPSALESGRDRALLGLTGDGRRPVRMHGKVRRNLFLLRFALRALGELIWSGDSWAPFLDPIITVHPDRLLFEAFNGDQSAYALVTLDMDLFELEGELQPGTTNIDFTAWLWGALGELRTSRETRLRIGPEGLDLRTELAGGRFEPRVELPESWFRGFLELQGAMAMAGTRLSVRPVDLLSAIRFLRYSKARMSPRAMRYELEPDQPARLVLEPWEHVVPLEGAGHGYAEPRTIRVWGRRRLRLIEPLLPFADGIDVYLKGRGLPHFYAVKLPDITFVLGLSGWSGRSWTQEASFSLLAGRPKAVDPTRLEASARLLAERFHLQEAGLAAELGIEPSEAGRLLERLVRSGRALYDVERRVFRGRELLHEPLDEARIFPPDPRLEAAERILEEGRLQVELCEPQETRRQRRLPSPDGRITRELIYRDWRVRGRVAGRQTEIVVGQLGRILFGTCECTFFQENLLQKGPCEHMLALYEAAVPGLQDPPSSARAGPEAGA
ncbi:MAG: SWIM zinc finger family protein [Armatimonadetes bacterium]|nr:SWIM zinc finger family protein [Armatimonadota bacterium]